MKEKPPLALRKRLGQNFLVDTRAKQRILVACDFKSDDEVLEIGPGMGALTELILPLVKKLYVIEKDHRFCDQLRDNFPNLEIFKADILKFDFKELRPGLKVIGNLPYYISTPIIEKFITHREMFPTCFFTVQKEFAQRLAAKVNDDSYGSLSCFIQYYADVKILFNLSPSCFKPAPKVTSSFIKIEFRKSTIKVSDEKKLFLLIRSAFGQRRKQIQNSLKPILGEKTFVILKECGFSGEERAENLSLEDFVKLAISSSRQTSD